VILTALRYRGPTDKEFHTWRFSAGVGSFSNFIAFHVESAALPDVAAALDYALTGQLSSQVTEVAAQLSDNGGDTWIIQRAGKQVRYLRNNAPVTESEAQTSMLAAVLDFGVTGAEAGIKSLPSKVPTPNSPGKTASTQTVFSIKATSRGLIRGPFDTSHSSGEAALQEVAFKEVDKSVAACVEECARTLRDTKFLMPAFTVQIATKLRSISEKYSEYRDQLRDLTQSDKVNSADVQKRVDHLAPELELLAEMEELAAPLLDPAQSAQVLRDSLEKIESELTDSLAAFGIDVIPSGAKVLDWRKPIDALSRFHIQRQLVAVSEQAINTIRERMEPAWQEYFSLLHSSVTKDLDMTSELESCVTSLQVRTREAERVNSNAESKKRSSPLRYARTWFERFKDDSESNSQNKKSADILQDPISAQSRLDSARMALDHSVSRMAILRAQLEHLKAEHPGTLTEITDQHERLISEFGRARDRWNAIAREYKLPEDIQITGLNAVVNRYSTMFALVEERDSLRTKIRERKNRLARLESLVASWRQHTGSQRSVNLANSQILLSEVRSILRYRQEKQEQYTRLLNTAEANRNALAVKAHLDARKTKLLGEWRRIFTDAGLTPVRIGDERLATLFDRATALQGLMTLDANLKHELPASIFDAAPTGLPICIYVWEDPGTTSGHREMLLAQIERASSPHFNMILTSDEGLAAVLASRGVGRAYAVESKRPVRQPHTPVISAPNGTSAPHSAPAVSGRAKAALEILTTKRQ